MELKIFPLADKLFSSRKILFALALVVTIAKALLLIHLTGCADPEIRLGNFSFSSGDTFSYTGAMENYLSKGSYFFFNGKENIYAGRLPHYSIPYFLFRQFTSESNAYDLITFSQILIQCFAIATIICWYFRLVKDRISTALLLIFFFIESNWTLLSIFVSPESLSCSLALFIIYQYDLYIRLKKKSDLLFTGFLMAILVTLKAYFILLFIPVGIHFLLEERGAIFPLMKAVIKKVVLVSIPLIVILSPWVCRNYIVYNKIIPLQINLTAGYNYTEAELAFRKFVTAWGDDFIFWEKTSAGCYFIPTKNIDCEFKLPVYVLTSKYGKQEVEEVRTMFIELQKQYSDSLNQKVAERFSSLTQSFKQEKPFRYYVLSPLLIAKKFLVHSGSYYLPIHTSNPCFQSPQLILKGLQSSLYWASLLLGIPGLVFLSIKLRNSLIIFLPIFIIILFPVFLRAAEARYFRTVEPVLYIGIVYLIFTFFSRIKKSGNTFA